MIGEVVKIIVDYPAGCGDNEYVQGAIGVVDEYDEEGNCFRVRTSKSETDGWWFDAGEFVMANDDECRVALRDALTSAGHS